MKPTAQASWGIDAIADGFNTSVAQHTALFTRVSGNLWLQQGLDQQGHAYMLELDWIPTIAELSVSYQFDPGTGFELVSQFSDLDYLGTSNYFSGARAWAGLHSAAVNFIGICTTGPWQFKY